MYHYMGALTINVIARTGVRKKEKKRVREREKKSKQQQKLFAVILFKIFVFVCL